MPPMVLLALAVCWGSVALVWAVGASTTCFVLVPVGLVLFEIKIRQEERLLLAMFPEEYPRYRREVPQLIPGLHALRRRRSVRS